MGVEPFETLQTGSDNDSEVVYVGVEGGFVNAVDYKNWRAEFKKWLTTTYLVKGCSFKHLESTLVEWAVGMIWPDQSYVSIRRFRVHHLQASNWSGFHSARFNMFVGEC
jgi:hypothetical protein